MAKQEYINVERVINSQHDDANNLSIKTHCKALYYINFEYLNHEDFIINKYKKFNNQY